MTRGALIFAFNNERTDYVRMAAWSAARIQRHLDLPVALVTNDPDAANAHGVFEHVIEEKPQSGGNRWFEDYEARVTWHNVSRISAFDISPWDETLVLDADYVVASSYLNVLWTHSSSVMCHKTAWNLATGEPLVGLNSFGRYDMPMWWATVMMFKRNNTAKYVFDCMQMIHRNWQHYRNLYGIDRDTYRNDFALSIALGIVSGHTMNIDSIPSALFSVMPEHELTQAAPDSFDIVYKNIDNKLKKINWSGMDFHAMGKQQLEKIIEAS